MADFVKPTLAVVRHGQRKAAFGAFIRGGEAGEQRIWWYGTDYPHCSGSCRLCFLVRALA